MLDKIVSIDQNIIYSITNLQNGFLDPIMVYLTQMGDFGMIWILIIIFAILRKKYRKEGLYILSGLVISAILGEGILKHIFMRPRPFMQLHDIVLKVPEPITSSFPSGHTSASFVFAILFTYFFWGKLKQQVIGVWILAIGITVSRLYLQVHYPSDILVGILIGIISASGVIIYDKKSKKITSK